MLNSFQQDILDYLETTAEHFISTLADDEHKFIVIDNIVPRLVKYLGEMIKRDLDLHAPRSIGYNKLEDMLIEIHIKPSNEFSSALVRVAFLPLRQKSVED